MAGINNSKNTNKMKQIIENRIKELQKEVKNYSNKYDVLETETLISELQSILDEASKQGGAEKTYSIGQRFKAYGKEYLLSRVDTNKINLINLKTGNRWGESIEVNNTNRIIQKEFNLFYDSHELSLIS